MSQKKPHIVRKQEKQLLADIKKAFGEPEKSPLMFYVWGIGGVGKSTLVEKIQEKLAVQYDDEIIFTKLSFGAIDETPLRVMEQLNGSLPKQGFLPFGKKSDPFTEAYKSYKQTLHELETIPTEGEAAVTAGQIELVRKLGKLVVTTGILGSQIASANPFSLQMASGTKAIADKGVDAVVDGSVTALSLKDDLLLRHQKTKKDQVLQELMLEPLPKLTEAFIDGLISRSKKKNIVLILDTFEKTSADVDTWLRQFFLVNSKLKSSNVRVVIAGRYRLGRREGWKDLTTSRASSLFQEFPLNEFNKEQTKQYLTKIGITNEDQIRKLQRNTKGLPFHLDLIRQDKEEGEAINFVEEIADRLLKALNTDQKKLVEFAACCRWFDQPLLEKMANFLDLDFNEGVDVSQNCFEWLKQLDIVEYVRESNGKYCIKDVARDTIRNHLHQRKNNNDFRKIHTKLKTYFEEIAQQFVPQDYALEKYQDPDWCRCTAEAIYHAFFSLRDTECRIYFLNHFFASRFFMQIEIVLAPVTAIAAESEIKEHNLLSNNNQNFLKDITVLLPVGWLKMCNHPSQKLKINDKLVPEDILTRVEAVIQKVCLPHVNELADGVAKFGLLYSKFYRCFAKEKIEIVNQLEIQAKLLIDYLPNNACSEIFYDLGNMLISLNKYEEVIADLDEAIKLKPDYPEAYFNRGAAKGSLERYEEAITDFDEAIQLKSDDPEAYFNRGIIKRHLERYEEAITDYDEAIQHKPNYPKAYVNRGIAKGDLEKYEEAIADYDEAIQLKPDYPEAYVERGICLTRLGQYNDALSDFNRAIELAPEETYIQVFRGVLFAWMSDYQKTVEICDQVLRDKPDDAPALYGKSCCYALQEKAEESIHYLELAINQDPRCKKQASKDPEFEKIRNDSRFQKLVS